jgi:hypothetical protein
MARRYALRDDQWERIKDLLPGRKRDCWVTAKGQSIVCRRGVVSLPSRHSVAGLTRTIWRFPVVHTRFSRWAKRGCVATGV